MHGHYAEDLTGKRFGRYTVVGRAENKGRMAYWVCKCDCGTIKEVRGQHLMYGKILSCGCLGKERRMDSLYKHHQSRTRLYFVYRNILNRCYNPKVRSYVNYGANGVKVCPEWRYSFSAFSRWALASGYDPDAPYGKCTIDRIDVYGDYCPENCRWVDLKVQAQNRRKKATA